MSNFKFNHKGVENFEKRFNIQRNLDFFIPDLQSMCFHLDPYRFVTAIEFFLCDYLSDIKPEYIKPIVFELDRKLDSKGRFAIGEEQFYILFSDINIKKNVDDNVGLESYEDEFLENILHEICHLKQFLKCCEENKIMDISEKFLDEYFDENEFKQYLHNKYTLDSGLIDIMFSDNEFEAEKFSYKNLSYLKTLYSNKGYYHSTTFCLVKEK